MNIGAGLHSELKKQFPVIMIGALTLIASLAWNDVIVSIIDRYIPEDKHKNAMYKLFYASVLTFIIIVIMYFVDNYF